MRVIRMVGVCALVLALSGVASSAASAEEYPLTGLPEIGRCVKVQLGTGHFNHAGCVGVDKDGNDGEYKWLPGPSEHGTFKLRLNSIVFETVGGGKINCVAGFLTGEYLNGKEVKVSKTVLQGCTDVTKNEGCFSNEVEQGVVESNQALVGQVGFIPNPKNEANPYVGVDLRAEPESVPLLTFNCGETLGESFAFEGSVIGKITKLNKMLAEDGIAYQQKAGHQKPEAFKGGVKDTLTETVTPVTNPLEHHSEQAGLGALGVVVNGEQIEFKAKQH